MSRMVQFVGGARGEWRVVQQRSLAGAALPAVERVALLRGDTPRPDGGAWSLRGIGSYDRYLHTTERTALRARQAALGRPQASCAALIPIRKRAQWWQLTQEERREIIEPRSGHVRIGLEYLPQVARELLHCHDLGEQEPFDFLTWFEFAPEHESAFDRLLQALRATPEWDYVERDVELRLRRERSA